MTGPGRLAAVALLLAVALPLAGCGSLGAPTPTPGGLGDVIAALVLRGVTVHQHVAGDAGCPASALHDNAVRLTVSMAAEATRSDVHVFRWRRQADFDAEADAFAACIAAQQQAGSDVLSTVEESPFRAYGFGWSDELRTAVAEALRAAIG